MEGVVGASHHLRVRTLALLSSLLLPAQAFAEWGTEQLGGTTVELYTPAALGRIGDGRPLLLMLHGCTQQAAVLKARGGFEPVADRHGMVVALPQVPGGGVLAGCWDYYGADHTRTNRHNGALLEMVEALLLDAALDIDPNQVYIAGLSSGAGQAAVLGCLAPDVFAGVGLNAGPTVGTAASETVIVSTTAAEAVAVCRALAGSDSSGFETQVASVIYGSEDYIVNTAYNTLNLEVLAELYGAAETAAFDVTSLEGHNPVGEGTLRSDLRGPRVSLIRVEGMGHAFPAGTGPGPEISFVASEGPSWPAYLAAFFEANNRRADGLRPSRDAGTGDPSDDDAGGPASGADGGAPGRDRRDGGVPRGDDEPPGGCRCAGAADSSGLWLLLVFLSALALQAQRSIHTGHADRARVRSISEG